MTIVITIMIIIIVKLLRLAAILAMTYRRFLESIYMKYSAPICVGFTGRVTEWHPGAQIE